MAAVFCRSPFDAGRARERRLSAARARFAQALAVSIFLHVWLAAGLPKAPQPALSSTVFRFTARLKQVAAPPGPETQSQPEGDAAGGNEPQLSPGRSESFIAQVPSSRSRDEQDASPAAELPVSALPLARPADPAYYPARELDAYPTLRVPLRFDYPERAAREQAGGRVTVMLLLDETGGIDQLEIVAAEPAGYFEDAVRAAFAAARFLPARKDKRAVKSQVLINIHYDPGAAEGTPSEGGTGAP